MPYQIVNITNVDIRSVFATEPQHFTPWVAANLERIAQATGLDDLELVQEEHPIGEYSCDIVARHASGVVIIENQFGKSDHNHFGKLCVYASGVKANCIIFIAEQIREEHRAAIDYWNDLAGNKCAIFGIEVAVITLDGEKVAVNLDVVSRPNQWQSQQKAFVNLDEKVINPAILRLQAAYEEQHGEHWKCGSNHIYKRVAKMTWLEGIINNAGAKVVLVIKPHIEQEALFNQAFAKVSSVCQAEQLPLPRANQEIANQRIYLDCPHDEEGAQIAWLTKTLNAIKQAFNAS